MLCDICHQHEAKLHLTKKERGKSDLKMHVCTVCFPSEASDINQADQLLRAFEKAHPNPPDSQDDE